MAQGIFHLKVRKGGQGWTDSQIVLSLVLLNLDRLSREGCV